MQKNKDSKYGLILAHLEYIKEKVDNNEIKLDRINGRVRKTENDLATAKGIGGIFSIIFSATLALFIKGE